MAGELRSLGASEELWMRQRWALESTDQVQKIFPHSAWEHTIQAAKVWIKRQCPRKGLSHLLLGLLSSCALGTTTSVFSHQSFHHCLLAHWSLGLTDSYTERFLGSQVIGLELSHSHLSWFPNFVDGLTWFSQLLLTQKATVPMQPFLSITVYAYISILVALDVLETSVDMASLDPTMFILMLFLSS